MFGFGKYKKEISKLEKIAGSLPKDDSPPPPKVQPKSNPKVKTVTVAPASAPTPAKARKRIVDVRERYIILRQKVYDRIADRFILDDVGKEAYKRTKSAYTVVGKFPVVSSFLDYDKTIREIAAMIDDKERYSAMRKLAQSLRVK